MRKTLTFILIILLLILAVTMVVSGIKIGNFQILSINQLKEENIELDDKILQAERVSQTTYKSELAKFEAKLNELQNNKKRYEELVAITSESNYEIASREENYKVEYLYYQLGEIAKQNNVDLKIEISTSSTGVEGLYDVTLITSYEAPITDESGYVKITDFIYAVENDSTLGFKVEDFSLVPYSVGSKTEIKEVEIVNEDGTVTKQEVSTSIEGYGLRGTFTAKNVAIQDITQSLLTQDKDNVTDENTQNGAENGTQNNTGNVIDLTE